MARFNSSSQILPSNWLGLAWVYSGILWLVPIWLGWSNGSMEQAGLSVLRMLATVAVGVGICGDERWGWATAVVLAFAYLLLGVSLVIVVGTALVSRPEGSLSWQPVVWGFTFRQCVQLEIGAALVSFAAALAAYLLFQARSAFDVPSRQVYGPLVKWGLLPAIGILMLDGGLLLVWR